MVVKHHFDLYALRRKLPHNVDSSQGQSLLFRVRDVFVHHGRAVRPGRPGHNLRTRDDADLPSHPAIFLVYPNFVGSG